MSIRLNILLSLTLVISGFKQDAGFGKKLADAAYAQTLIKVKYVPDYVVIPYPNGDVPEGTGVCTDLVIRAYRKLGIDLQQLVHEDMKMNFKKYPGFWKLKGTDKNIDHRRVPNLMVFFERKGASVKITEKAENYLPGDIVTWNLSNKKTASGITHIGIVTSMKNETKERYLIAHNIGRGNELEDMLFDFTIIGHYRFFN